MVSESTREGLRSLARTDFRLRLSLAAGAFAGLGAFGVAAALDYGNADVVVALDYGNADVAAALVLAVAALIGAGVWRALG